jgi:uncharacterized peroxidase-related enzyme
MAQIPPLRREDLPDLEPLFGIVESVMGFLPNSLLTMARRPELAKAFLGLAGVVQGPGKVDPETKHLVSFVSSRAAGCRYCQAHTGHSAERAGAAPDKIDAAFEFETHDLFDDAERAALRLARDASLTPGAVTDAHFEALRRHYDEDAILEIVAVIALFGWLNRWNDTLGTALEARPLDFASSHLTGHGWEAGPHGSGGSAAAGKGRQGR